MEAQKNFLKDEFLPTDYIRVGKFVNGLADGAVPSAIGKVSELLIRVNDHTGQNWVIISEVCMCCINFFHDKLIYVFSLSFIEVS